MAAPSFRKQWLSRLLTATGLACLPIWIASAEPMHFSEAFNGGNCDDCEWISAEGTITAETPAKLRSFLKTPQHAGLLLINSLGGSLLGGLELGRLIRARGLNVRVAATVGYPTGHFADISTNVAGVCASACVFALMGGVQRDRNEGSRIGIHQFASTQKRSIDEQQALASTQMAVANLSSFASEMSVSPDVIALGSGVPASTILWLSNEQLEATNLITSRTTPREEEWQLQPSGSALSAVVGQVQQDGKRVGFGVSCSKSDKLLMMIAVPTGKDAENQKYSIEVAKSIKKIIFFHVNDKGYSNILELPGMAQYNNFIIYASVRLTFEQLQSLATEVNPYEVRFDLSHSLSSWVGYGFAVPRSNLRALLPYIIKSCS